MVEILKPLHPDLLTWTAFGFSVLSGVLFLFSEEKPLLFFFIILLLFLRIALNALDGMVAKETGKARPQGELLNELLDRASDVAILLGLGFSPLVHIQIAILTIPLVLISSYTGILGKALGTRRQYGGIMGKADRVILLMVFSLIRFIIDSEPKGLFLFDYALIIILVGVVVTIFQRIFAIRKELE